MKRFLLALMIVFSVMAFAACDPKEDIGGNGGNGGGGNEGGDKPVAIVMSEVPETASAELGERFDLPEVTAKQGDKDVAVTVSVKDSKGEEVELQGRGTRFSATDLDGYTVTFTAGAGEGAVVRTMTVTVTDSKGPELTLPASATNITVTKGGTVYLPSYEWTDKSGVATDLGYKVTFGGSEVQVTTGGVIYPTRSSRPNTAIISSPTARRTSSRTSPRHRSRCSACARSCLPTSTTLPKYGPQVLTQRRRPARSLPPL